MGTYKRSHIAALLLYCVKGAAVEEERAIPITPFLFYCGAAGVPTTAATACRCSCRSSPLQLLGQLEFCRNLSCFIRPLRRLPFHLIAVPSKIL